MVKYPVYSRKYSGNAYPVADVFGTHNGGGTFTGTSFNNSSAWSSCHMKHGWGWGSGKMSCRIISNSQTGGEGHAGFCDSVSGCMTSSSTFPVPSGDVHSYGNYVNYGTTAQFAIDFNKKLAWMKNIVWGNNYWNGTAGAHPCTGIGGYDISGMTPPIYFDVCFWSNNNVTVVCDFTTPFLAGYTGWLAAIPDIRTPYQTFWAANTSYYFPSSFQFMS